MATAESLYLQAAEAYRKDDFDRALAVCDRLLTEIPDTAAAPAVLNLKSLSLAGKGLLFAAAECIDQAIQLKPDDPLLQHHAARILLELGRNRAARMAAEQACRLAPEHSGYRYHLARVHMLEGRVAKAEELVRRCVAADPAAFEARLLLSELLSQGGDRQQAVTFLQEIIGQDPDHARALARLAELAPAGEVELPLLEALERVRATANDVEDAATATFALADVARRAGNHAQAFARYREANNRLAMAEPISMDDWEREVETTVSQSGQWLESDDCQAARERAVGDRLVFIVGMPRSGTSLCEQIVCTHPRVLGAGELATMEHIEKALRHSNTNPYGTEKEPAWLEEMRRAYLASLPSAWAGQMWASDKTPRNFERLGLIFRLFPAARVLWCVRHPLDTVLSCYFQDFGAGQKFSRRLDHCARMYVGQVRLMRHWTKYFGRSIQTVDYSRLVENLETSVRAIADFLGLDVVPEMLEPHRNPRMVWTASGEQVKRPVYTNSLGNWQHYSEEVSEVRDLLTAHGLLDEQGISTVLG